MVDRKVTVQEKYFCSFFLNAHICDPRNAFKWTLKAHFSFEKNSKKIFCL